MDSLVAKGLSSLSGETGSADGFVINASVEADVVINEVYSQLASYMASKMQVKNSWCGTYMSNDPC